MGTAEEAWMFPETVGMAPAAARGGPSAEQVFLSRLLAFFSSALLLCCSAASSASASALSATSRGCRASRGRRRRHHFAQQLCLIGHSALEPSTRRDPRLLLFPDYPDPACGPRPATPQSALLSTRCSGPALEPREEPWKRTPSRSPSHTHIPRPWLSCVAYPALQLLLV